MSFCCVCYDAGPNKLFEIQKEDPKYLTTTDILKKINPDYSEKDNERDISLFIWHRTTRCATNLKDDEYPLTNYPSLVLSKRPELYESLPESLQIYTALASTEIQNGHPGYSIFYLDVKHTTGHNIPRIYLPVMTKKMSRASHDLYDIINESFATLGSVETKAIYKGNGEAFTQLSSVRAVFDELQQLDANQNNIANNKKKNNNDLEEAAKKNVTVEIEFSENAQQKLAQRKSLSEEILATEKQYLECLNKIDQFWAPKLKEESLLTDEEHDYIFKDIKTIMSSHQAFCASLEKVENGYASEFGRLFLSYAPFFKISADYISKYSLINKMLEKKARESEDFTQKINDLAKEASQDKALPNDLSGYLIQPVKRFPYYSTFLKNFIKVTPKNHPDALFLPLAKKEISDFISQVEEKADSTTKNAILMNIQISNSDGFDYVTPQRKLTQSFPASYISNPSLSTNSNKQNNELQEKQGYFHVCNDYVFLVDQDTSKCIYKSPLLQFHYLNSPEQNKITVSTIKDAHGANTDEYVTKSYDIQFQNEEDQNNFFSLIEPQAEQKAESTTLPNRSFLWKAKKPNSELKPVSDHASVFNGKEHVFYGGCGNGEDEYYSDFVLYNNDDVNEVQSGIKGRKLHTFTNVNNKLFVIGGETASGQKSSKIFVYDGENKGWTAVECPELSQQSCHTAAPNGKDEIIVYGGIPSFDQIYSINTNTYEVKKLPIEDSQSQDQKKIPANRYGHSAVVHNNKMIVYGGRSTETDEILSDLWSFDLAQNKWSLIKWDLLPRSSHSAHVLGDEMIIIGGEGSNQSFSVNLNDYNVKFIDEYGNLPTTLIGSSVSFDPTTKNIVVYGGRESHGGPSTAALYEVTMSQDWKDSINENPEVVERDIVSDLNPNFIEVDENGSVKEVPNPEEAEEGIDNVTNEEEEVELEIDVELGEEDGGENIDEDENDVVENFNLSDDKDEEVEGGDNQNANGYSNDMNFDEIIDDIKEDEKNDEKIGEELDEEFPDFKETNSNQDQEQQEGPEEDVEERDQQQDDNKLSTEPQEDLSEDDLNLDELNEEEEEGNEQTEPEKNPWELASDDIQDGLSDDQNHVNQFEPDEDKGNQNGEDSKNDENQFEPDEDNENQNGEEDENEGNQFEPDEDKENNNAEEENGSESLTNGWNDELNSAEEEEDEAESNPFTPDSNNPDNNLSDSELETPPDEFDNNEINDLIDGVDEAEEKLDEAQKIQDQHKNDGNTDGNISSDLDTDKLSEDLDLSNEKLSTNSEEEEDEVEIDSENKNQDENETESNNWKNEESDHFGTSDKDNQKVSSSSHHHHHHSSSSSPSRGHHHHHSSSHGHSHSHSHSRHHSSRRDSSDYLHSESSHRRESDHGHGNNNYNNDNVMDDSSNSTSTDDLFNSSDKSHSSSAYGGGGSTSHHHSPFGKKPKISKEKKKELEKKKNLMYDQSSDMSSSLSPSIHKKHRNGGKSDLSFDDSEGSDESAAPTFSMKDKSKEKYRFTTFSLQKTNCSYLNQNDNSSSYGGYQSPGFSQRTSPRTGGGTFGSRSSPYSSGSRTTGGYGSASKSSPYGSGSRTTGGYGSPSKSNSSYLSPSRPRNSGTSSYFNSSSSTSNAAPPSFALSPTRRRPNFDLESSFNDDDFGTGGGYSSPSRNKYSNYSGSSPANRSGKDKGFFRPSDFINDSPFSKKNRSNDPLYATGPTSRYGRHDDE